MGHNDLGDYYYDRGDLQVCVYIIMRLVARFSHEINVFFHFLAYLLMQ